jgi:hypothetical protein
MLAEGVDPHLVFRRVYPLLETFAEGVDPRSGQVTDEHALLRAYPLGGEKAVDARPAPVVGHVVCDDPQHQGAS